MSQPLHPHEFISGFLKDPKKSADGSVYRGRFTCPKVQWTGEGDDSLVTFTITAEELVDIADNRLLWTDQNVQRGIRPEIKGTVERELALADGYPDQKTYIFDGNNADDIAEKLLRGERLFLTPLVWNLRPGTFEAFWCKKDESLFIYSGKIFLPDSHHRQQGIIKAVRAFRESKSSYPKFSPTKQFKVELYFLTREDEGNYFFDKNQRPRPTAKSKAFDLTTQDDLSLLAKRVVEKSKALKDNINRVTDRLTASNIQVVTLSTVREMMRVFSLSDTLDEAEIDGLALVAASFYDLLAEARPELGQLSLVERRKSRDELLVDSAVMMHGYAYVMSDFNDSIAKLGLEEALKVWRSKTRRFESGKSYSFDTWSGDFFSKTNPLWKKVGVVKPSRDGRKLTVLNTGAARSECGRVLRQFLSTSDTITDLSFLAVG